jgi:Glycosyl transferase family 2
MSRNRLPIDYTVREHRKHFIDFPDGIVYQPEVYELLSFLAKRSGTTRIIEIGAGFADKLRELDQKFEVICIDTQHVRHHSDENVFRAKFLECDLERGLASIEPSLWDGSLVVCVDIFERLREPENLARDLASVRRRCAFMLISTPDRVRARGPLDQGPPVNLTHTMEWTIDEFARFLKDCGFESLRVGYTRGSSISAAKNSILAIAGREAEYVPVIGELRVAAIIHVFNESDAIESIIRHLNREGVEVHIFDNWSDDGSFELCERLLAEGLLKNLSRFPDQPSLHYEWTEQLKQTEQYAQNLPADWIIHHDADEIRVSPWSAVTLVDAIKFVDSLGYSAIDFTVLNFVFTDRLAYNSDFEPSDFVEFDFGRQPEDFLQIKGWKNLGLKVDLAAIGGHSAQFPSRRVYPLKFVTKHYPLRSARQAHLKVFRHRIPRLSQERLEKGWHQHYDIFELAGSIEPWRSCELSSFDEYTFQLDFIIEVLSGIGIEQYPDCPLINIRTLLQVGRVATEKFRRVSDENQKLEQRVAELELSSQAAQSIATQRLAMVGAEREMRIKAETRIAALRAEVVAITTSTSWRATARLRAMLDTRPRLRAAIRWILRSIAFVLLGRR